MTIDDPTNAPDAPRRRKKNAGPRMETLPLRPRPGDPVQRMTDVPATQPATQPAAPAPIPAVPEAVGTGRPRRGRAAPAAKAHSFGGHEAIEHYQESLQRTAAMPPVPLPPAAPKPVKPAKRGRKGGAVDQPPALIELPIRPTDPPQQLVPTPLMPEPETRHRHRSDDDDPAARGRARIDKPRLRPAPLAAPPRPPGAMWASNPAGTAAGDGTDASAPSATTDPLRDVRDLIQAFRAAIEKLAQAAEKLAEAGAHPAAQRLDVA